MQGAPGVQEVLLALGAALMLASLCVGAYAARAYLKDDVRGAREELGRLRATQGRSASWPGVAPRGRGERPGAGAGVAREIRPAVGRGEPRLARPPCTPTTPPASATAPTTAPSPASLPTLVASPILAPAPHGCASEPTLDLRHPLPLAPPEPPRREGTSSDGAVRPAARHASSPEGEGAAPEGGAHRRGDRAGRPASAEADAGRGVPAVSSMGEASELEGVMQCPARGSSS